MMAWDIFPKIKVENAFELIALLDSNVNEAESLATSNMKTILSQVKETTKSLLMLLEKPTGSIKMDDVTFNGRFSFKSNDVLDASKSWLRTVALVISKPCT